MKKDNSPQIDIPGYKTVELTTTSRHIFGKIEKVDTNYFFKTVTPDNQSPENLETLNTKLQTESGWYLQVNNRLQQENNNLFRVPKIVDSGLLNNNFYYISEYVDGLMLATKRTKTIGPQNSILNDNIAKVTKILLFLNQTEQFQLPGDVLKKNLSEAETITNFIAKTQKWYTPELKNIVDLSKNLEELQNFEHNLEFGMNHGDFTPWHILQSGNFLYIIDPENASCFSPKYYDVAYFYHRTYTGAESPQQARLFASLFRQSLKQEEKNNFDSLFKTLLASRIVGGFWDALNDKIQNLDYHVLIQQDFLNNKFYD